MTRINLLYIARAVLLGVCFLCISSVSVWAEENKISVTAYTLKECYHNKGKTASGEMVRTGIVAVSPDLERKGLKLGTEIKIGDMGTFIVKRSDKSQKSIFILHLTVIAGAVPIMMAHQFYCSAHLSFSRYVWIYSCT
jgi:hypothetical protein